MIDKDVAPGTRRIPIEVEYRRRIDPHDDTRGLRAFIENIDQDRENLFCGEIPDERKGRERLTGLQKAPRLAAPQAGLQYRRGCSFEDVATIL